MPAYQAGWHHQALAEHLDKFVSGELRRLMVFMPPRHGKSELVSRRLPAYILGRNPEASIIACSYSADLASRMNRDVQRIMDSDAYQRLFPEVRLYGSNARKAAQGAYLRNSDVFEVVGHRGTYRSAGVGGGITGMGYDRGIIDDPVKNQEEADSQTYREGLWEWFTSTFYTRQEKDAGILITMTRWHEDDLAGRLLRLQAEGGDQWTVVHYPALSDRGEALWPEKYSLGALGDIRKAVGGRVWEALYQGRPAPPGGAIFKREWLQYTLQPGREFMTNVVQAWDTAYKQGQQADYSACVTVGSDRSGRIHVLDVWRGRVEFPELVTAVQRQHEIWRPNAIIVEDQASGTSAVQHLKRTSMLPLVTVRPERDKQARASAMTPYLEGGRVWLPPLASWRDEFETELLAFPTGQHDDQVDAFVYALERIITPTTRVRVR